MQSVSFFLFFSNKIVINLGRSHFQLFNKYFIQIIKKTRKNEKKRKKTKINELMQKYLVAHLIQLFPTCMEDLSIDFL